MIMSKERVIVTGTKLKCDVCGEYYCDEDNGGNFIPDDTTGDEIEECATEDGWVVRGQKHYCPKCAYREEKSNE